MPTSVLRTEPRSTHLRPAVWCALAVLAGLAALAGPAHAADTAPAITDSTARPPALAAQRSPAASVAAFPAPQRRAWQAGLLRADRIEHASLSFTLAAALVLATRDRTAAAASAIALGVAKECWDARGPSGFDAVDLLADGCGVSLAVITVRTH